MITGIPDPVALAHAAQHFPTVHLGHHHVQQDEVGRLLLECGEPLLGAAGLAHRVALELEVHAHVLADALVVVHDQDERPDCARFAGTGMLEEGLEIGAPVTAVAARRVERRHALEVGPLPDRALRDAEVLRRLAQGQPLVGLPRRPAPPPPTSRKLMASDPHL